MKCKFDRCMCIPSTTKVQQKNINICTSIILDHVDYKIIAPSSCNTFILNSLLLFWTLLTLARHPRGHCWVYNVCVSTNCCTTVTHEFAFCMLRTQYHYITNIECFCFLWKEAWSENVYYVTEALHLLIASLQQQALSTYMNLQSSYILAYTFSNLLIKMETVIIALL